MLIVECFKHNIFVILSLIIDYSHGESSFIIFLKHIVFSFIKKNFIRVNRNLSVCIPSGLFKSITCLIVFCSLNLKEVYS